MPRRNNSILDIVFLLPWWVSVLLAFIAYGGLKYAIPSIRTESTLLNSLGEIGPVFAPFVALLFLLPASFSLYKDKGKKKHGDSRQDM
jgi:hypothetical protein